MRFMTNDPRDHFPEELSWRRKLSPEQDAELRAWLAAHPEARADWEEEAALTAGLERLADVPVASNFTARVLQVVEREDVVREQEPKWHQWLRGAHWLPRAAFAAVVVGVGLTVAPGRTFRIVTAERVDSSEKHPGAPRLYLIFDVADELTSLLG